MKKRIISLLLLIAIVLTNHSIVFAGIPIQEKASVAQEKVTAVETTQKVKKGNKLKQKIAQRVLHKMVPHENSDLKTLSIILAIILPFVGVAVWQDGITKDFWITLILTLLLYIPGLIYALTVILNGSK